MGEQGRFSIVVAGMLCWLLLAAPLSLHADTALRLAPVPVENAQAQFKRFQPLVRHLEAQLQQSVELVFYPSHTDIVTALARGELDLAVMGALPYVTLRLSEPAVEPLVFFHESDRQRGYHCVLAQFIDEPVKPVSPVQLEIAVPPLLSTCGAFMARMMWQQYAPEAADYAFVHYGSHDDAALAVVSGHQLVAGLKDTVAHKYASLGLEVVLTSEEVPPFLLVAGTRLTPAEHAALRRALLEAEVEPQGILATPLSLAADEDFLFLRQLYCQQQEGCQ